MPKLKEIHGPLRSLMIIKDLKLIEKLSIVIQDDIEIFYLLINMPKSVKSIGISDNKKLFEKWLPIFYLKFPYLYIKFSFENYESY